jgi:hypothetical protein
MDAQSAMPASGNEEATLSVDGAAISDDGAMSGQPMPYARSWLDILIDWVDGLPGPAGLAYLIALIPALVLLGIPEWLSGGQVGEISPTQAVWALALVGPVWLIHYLDGVARGALATFAPTLGADRSTLATLEYELTVIPARPALLLLLFSALRTTEAFVLQPASEGLDGQTPAALIIRWPLEVVVTGLVLVLLYHTVRQLRLVARIHAMAPRVNLFRPVPLYAFSRLTSRTAIGLAALIIPFGVNLSLATSALDYLSTFTLYALILGTAVLAFVSPLVGMHRRMDLEKKRLQTEVGTRIEILIDDLHASVDRRDLAGADGQNKTLTSLIAERELLRRLSTWPWQAGTAGAVLSAVMLPIGLWLVTRLLGNVI